MSYPNGRNPREIRSYLHTAYDRYIHGVDVFPSVIVSPTDVVKLPSKTQPIAAALSAASLGIAEDALRTQRDCENIGKRMFVLWREHGGSKAIVVGRLGLNAARMSILEYPAGSDQGYRDFKDFDGDFKDELMSSDPFDIVKRLFSSNRGIDITEQPPHYVVIRKDEHDINATALNTARSGYVNFRPETSSVEIHPIPAVA